MTARLAAPAPALSALLVRASEPPRPPAHSLVRLPSGARARVPQKRAVKAGALGACVAAMRAHPDDALAQQHACGALWSLSLLPEHKGLAAGAGAIEAVVFALNRHPAHAGVQHEARRLPSLCLTSVRSLCLFGRVSFLLFLNASVVSPSSMQGCGALWTLAVTAENQHAATQAGALEAAVSALANHGGDPSVQEAACGAIANIAWSRVDIQVRRYAPGSSSLLYLGSGESRDPPGVCPCYA